MLRAGACVLRDGSCRAALSTRRLPRSLCHGSPFPGAGERVMKRRGKEGSSGSSPCRSIRQQKKKAVGNQLLSVLWLLEKNTFVFMRSGVFAVNPNWLSLSLIVRYLFWGIGGRDLWSESDLSRAVVLCARWWDCLWLGTSFECST